MIGADVTEHAGQRIAVGVVWGTTPGIYCQRQAARGYFSRAFFWGGSCFFKGLAGRAVPGGLAVVPVVEVGCSWRSISTPLRPQIQWVQPKSPRTEVPTPPRTVVKTKRDEGGGLEPTT